MDCVRDVSAGEMGGEKNSRVPPKETVQAKPSKSKHHRIVQAWEAEVY